MNINVNKKISIIIVSFLLFTSIWLGIGAVDIRAAQCTITFDEESYESINGEKFSIDVFITGDEDLGTYYVELKYDDRWLKYDSGAETGGNGVVVLTGTSVGKRTRYNITFECLSGGNTEISVKNAKVTTKASGYTEGFKINTSAKTVINIAGVENVPDRDEVKEIPYCGATVREDGERYFIVDLSSYVPENADWNYRLVNGTIGGIKLTYMVDLGNSGKFLYLTKDGVNFELFAVGVDDGLLYESTVIETSKGKYYLFPVAVSNSWPEELTLKQVNLEAVYVAMDLEGNVGFYHLTNTKELIEWDENSARESSDNAKKIYQWIFIISGSVIFIFIALSVARVIILSKAHKENENTDDMDLTIVDLAKEDEVADEEDVVIAVKNVTMKFKISNSSASGLKEYFIQLITKKINYRELYALNNVSFNVKKGEIVGIIGTNGSGKSTVLRIISGALNPSSGTVKVDRKKLQLLTLGTGFDMELTARENVYLNGAIIGLNKEFLDENFDSIVEFAELDGFMDEKVKNFSSGMVSRLGFAIATAGEVSDILILDEILSVGDEHFRSKSLARVQEMMHSGSTVLMVSHSTQSILDNCTKVVWIEKGRLRMVGDPREVCQAYKNSFRPQR